MLQDGQKEVIKSAHEFEQEASLWWNNETTFVPSLGASDGAEDEFQHLEEWIGGEQVILNLNTFF